MAIPIINKPKMLLCPVLGRGGIAEVRKVEILDRQVAVKIPKTDDVYIESLYREARVLSNLSGVPNIVSFQGFLALEEPSFGSDYVPCLTFEVIHGPNLEKKCLGNESPLSQIKALNIMTDIAHALAGVHQKGIAHRDVKPGNILLNDGKGILIDFDMAEDIGRIIRISGTPGYIAPECYNFSPPSSRTDIFALGITLFEIVTGTYAVREEEYLFCFCRGESFCNIEKQVKRSKLSTPVKDLILRMAALSPHDRLSSCEEVIEEIAKTKEQL